DKIQKSKTSTYIADTASKEMQGIHQLVSGTLKVNDDVSVTVDDAKVRYIKQHFKGKKIGIFYNYKQEFEMLKQHFDNWTDDDKIFNENEDKRSEEHTSELQSRENLVCRLLLEENKQIFIHTKHE